jgi:hypothetical protein
LFKVCLLDRGKTTSLIGLQTAFSVILHDFCLDRPVKPGFAKPGSGIRIKMKSNDKSRIIKGDNGKTFCSHQFIDEQEFGGTGT